MRTVLIAIAFIAACPSIVLADELDHCKCSNIRQLRDRWCSARAARAEYERIINFLDSEKKRTGRTKMWTSDGKDMVNQNCVQDAIDSVSDKGVKKATARTNESSMLQLANEDCAIEITQYGSGCLEQVVDAHESVHRQACLIRNQMRADGLIELLARGEFSNALGFFMGEGKFSLLLADFADEESAGYAMEMQLIAAKWKGLQKTCDREEDFKAVLEEASTVGEDMYRNAQQDSDGKRKYDMYDLTEDPCPSQPPKPKPKCELK
jgi:hypothetical protein